MSLYYCDAVSLLQSIVETTGTTTNNQNQIGEVVTTIPTIGFNVESVTYKNLNFNVWDLGGQTSIRPYWRCYYANTAAVIFVVDSTDIERLQTAAEELAAMLNEEELRDAALLVFANKQDQPGAKGAGEISEALRLGELRDRNWSIMACSAVDGSGVNEGMDWLVVSRSLLSIFASWSGDGQEMAKIRQVVTWREPRGARTWLTCYIANRVAGLKMSTSHKTFTSV